MSPSSGLARPRRGLSGPSGRARPSAGLQTEPKLASGSTSPTNGHATIASVGRKKEKLEPGPARDLRRILRNLERAESESSKIRDEFARFVAVHGQAAVANELGVSRQAIQNRVKSRPKPKKKA